MIRHKKARSLMTFVEIIFFAALFFVGLKAFSMFMDMWVGDNLEQGTLKTLERMQIEADNMIEDEITIPIYIDEKHMIKGFESGTGLEGCREGNSCICVCKKDSNCNGNALKKCLPLRSDILPFTRTSFSEGEDAKTTDCTLKKSQTAEKEPLIVFSCNNG